MSESGVDGSEMANRFAAVRTHFADSERRELSQREMADRVGVTKNTWQRYEAGDLPSATVLLKLASEGINSHWLLTGEGEMLLDGLDLATAKHTRLKSEVEAMGYVHLPYYNVDATAGDGSLVEIDQPIRRVGFHREWLNREVGVNPSNLILLNSKGDSALPQIKDGDLLMLDISEPKLRSGTPIYAFVHSGMLYIKRLERRLDGGLIVSSDNSDLYKPEELSADQAAELNIIGRVVWNAGKI